MNNEYFGQLLLKIVKIKLSNINNINLKQNLNCKNFKLNSELGNLSILNICNDSIYGNLVTCKCNPF